MMRSLCDCETQAGEVPYLATNFAAAGCRRILVLLFPRTSSAASQFAAMRVMAKLSVSRRISYVSNGPKSRAGFPVLHMPRKSYFCKYGFAVTWFAAFPACEGPPVRQSTAPAPFGTLVRTVPRARTGSCLIPLPCDLRHPRSRRRAEGQDRA